MGAPKLKNDSPKSHKKAKLALVADTAQELDAPRIKAEMQQYCEILRKMINSPEMAKKAALCVEEMINKQ